MKVVGRRMPGFIVLCRFCKQLDSAGGCRLAGIRAEYPHNPQLRPESYPMFGDLWIESGVRGLNPMLESTPRLCLALSPWFSTGGRRTLWPGARQWRYRGLMGPRTTLAKAPRR